MWAEVYTTRTLISYSMVILKSAHFSLYEMVKFKYSNHLLHNFTAAIQFLFSLWKLEKNCYSGCICTNSNKLWLPFNISQAVSVKFYYHPIKIVLFMVQLLIWCLLLQIETMGGKNSNGWIVFGGIFGIFLMNNSFFPFFFFFSHSLLSSLAGNDCQHTHTHKK